jgi:hypothetical protein
MSQYPDDLLWQGACDFFLKMMGPQGAVVLHEHRYSVVGHALRPKAVLAETDEHHSAGQVM